MDFDAPLRGKTVNGIWVPNSAFEEKSDRAVSGLTPSGDYSGVLEGAPRAQSRFRDYQSYIEAIKTVPWVYACVSLLAYSFATAPGDLMDIDTDDVVEDPHHPFLQMWHRPNPSQSGMVFRELLAMYMELAGEAFISLEEMDGSGQPTEWYLPSPARMRVVQAKRTGDVIGYVYDTSGYQNGRYLPNFIPYNVDEIIHIKAANPLNVMRGLGNIEAMEVTMDTMVAMTRNELSYWQSGGRITGVLETDQNVDEETFNRLVGRWQAFTADKKQRFKTAILEQGLKYSPVAEGFKGLDYSKLDLAKRDFVLANFGVPKNKLGIIEDAQYKSDEADRFFWSETMEPRLTRFEDHIQPLVDLYDTDKAWKFQRKNWEDDTVKLNNAMIMQSLKSFDRDEIRVYIGAPPVGGKSGKVVILQQTDVPVQIDQMDEADTSTGTAGGGPPPMKPPDDPAKIKPPTVPAHSHAAGTNPISGVSTAANGNENGRTGAVDSAGHLPNKPNVHNSSEAAASKDWKGGFSKEAIDALTEEDRDVMRRDFDRRVKAAKLVARNMRARGRKTTATGLGRVIEYAEKRAALPRPIPRAGHVGKPGTAELVSSTAKKLVTSATQRFAPKLREAFSSQRRALTPVLSKALKMTDATERRKFISDNFPREKGPAQVVEALHAEAANEGWRVGKRSLGFAPKTAADFEVKAVVLGHEPLVSPFLQQRYERTIGTSINGIDDTTEEQVQDLVTEGLRRGYSPLQIASGVPDEEFAGVNSVFDDAYRAEMIARTETMFAYNWGAGNALVDSGVTEEEALDGSDDPECAARNGETYDIDPETGFAIDQNGEQIRDHPNGTLAFIPTGDLSNLMPDGAVEELGFGRWEQKRASKLGISHRMESKGDVVGHEFHGNQWTNGGVGKIPTRGLNGGTRHTDEFGNHLPIIGMTPYVELKPGDPNYNPRSVYRGGSQAIRASESWVMRDGRETVIPGSRGDSEHAGAALEAEIEHEKGHENIESRDDLERHLTDQHGLFVSRGMPDDQILHAHRDAHGVPHSHAPAVPPFASSFPAGGGENYGKDVDLEIVATLKDATRALGEIASKYNEDQPRGEDGRWDSSGDLGVSHAGPDFGNTEFTDHAGDALDLLKTTGGFTYSTRSRTFVRVGQKGYGVSPYKDREKTFDRPVTRVDVKNYARENADLLQQPDHYLGGWQDGDKTVLDVSIVTPSETEAHAIASRANQDAIFNFATGESIPTRKR